VNRQPRLRRRTSIASLVFLTSLTLSISGLSATAAQADPGDNHLSTVSAAQATAANGVSVAAASSETSSWDFPVPGETSLSPLGAGSDGDMWFGDGSNLDRISPSGVLTSFPTGEASLSGVQVGPDGNVWFDYASGASGGVGTLVNGVVHTFGFASGRPRYLKQGGGFLWAMAQGGALSVVRIAMDGTETSYPGPADISFGPFVIGPNGQPWFIDSDKSKIGARFEIGTLTPAGDFQEYPVDGNLLNPESLMLSTTGTLWFTNSAGAIMSIDSVGTVTVQRPEADNNDLLLIPALNGSMWFYDDNGDEGNSGDFGLVSPTGKVTPVLEPNLNVSWADSDSNGNLWLSGYTQPATGPSEIVVIEVTPSGVISTREESTGPVDQGLSADSDGNVYAINVAGQFHSGIGSIVEFTESGEMDRYPIGVGVSAEGGVVSSTGQMWFTFSDGSVGTTPPLSTSRVAGADRYASAIAVSQQEFPHHANVVYVASGDSYPDALSAGPAAAAQNGPLLLTDPAALPSNVKTEIQRLNPSQIVVVGGTSAVSAVVFNALSALAPTTRVSGIDRYATSRAVATYAFPNGASAVYVATGANFPDALSAGAAAGSIKGPLLLIDGTSDALDAPTSALLRALHVSHITIAGGVSAIGAGFQTSLAKIATTTRDQGADRYATSNAIAASAFPKATNVFLSTGENFPDALSGSAWAASAHQPLYITPGTCVSPATLAEIATQGATHVTLIGGTDVLSVDIDELAPCTAG
jgi:putative cell wall-binding protein/streptogramin lyase